MKQNIKIISLILALCCIVFLADCDGTNFQGKKLAPSPAKGSGDETDGAGDDENKNGNLTDTDPKKELKYVQDHPEIQAGKKVQVCIAYASPAYGHTCDQAKFNLFFNDETKSNALNLDNKEEREVTTISGHKLKVSAWLTSSSYIPNDFSDAEKAVIKQHRGAYSNQHVPGTLYETAWRKDGSITTTLKCKGGQQWNGYKCHVGTAVISIIGEVEISDGSTKYLATELVQFQTQEEAKQSFSYTGVTDGTTIGNVKFHLRDTPYEFDDYCGFKE